MERVACDGADVYVMSEEPGEERMLLSFVSREGVMEGSFVRDR